jgi:SAM-dependent methyltransferase
VVGYDPARYGNAVGDDYDVLYPGIESETRAAVELLSDLALASPSQSLLELGIGTGRLALELKRRGVKVAGIDGSERMIAALRAKEGSADISVTLGDYRDTKVPGEFGVVVLALNGIFDPRGAEAQLDIFRNAALHLETDGVFVVESWVMNEAQRSGSWTVMPRFVSDNHVELQLSRYHLDTNSIERTLVHLRNDGLKFVTVTDTYASPGELDVMARATGFERIGRYADWRKAEFSIASSSQVSIFRLMPHPGRF